MDPTGQLRRGPDPWTLLVSYATDPDPYSGQQPQHPMK